MGFGDQFIQTTGIDVGTVPLEESFSKENGFVQQRHILVPTTAQNVLRDFRTHRRQFLLSLTMSNDRPGFSQQFIQFTETETVRFIGPEDDQGEEVDKFLGKFRQRAEIPAGLYENQVNDGPVMSNDTAVGIGVRADLDEELVYRITKAFWENLGSITTDAPWAKALSPDYAAQTLGTATFHPGAARYGEHRIRDGRERASESSPGDCPPRTSRVSFPPLRPAAPGVGHPCGEVAERLNALDC